MPSIKRSRSSRSRSRSRSVAPTQRMDMDRTVSTGYVARIPRNVGMVLPKYICTLKYTDYPTITTIPSYYYYNINSAFQPNASIGGVNALGFAQLTNMYEKFIVESILVKVTFTNRDATGENMKCLVGPVGNGIAVTTKFDQQPRTKTAFCGNSKYNKSVSIIQKFNLWELLNVSKTDYFADWIMYGHSATASPVESLTLAVGVDSFVNTVALTNVTCNVELWQTIRSYDPVALTA